MAACTLGVATSSTANSTSYASGSFTPAADDLLVAFVNTPSSAGFGTMSDSQGLGFTEVTRAVYTTSNNTLYCFVADALAANSSMTVTFDCTGDSATGCNIVVIQVSGMSKVALDAVVQSDITENQTAGSAPTATFPASATTSNPTLAATANRDNPATLTEPSGWTERADIGFTTPDSGLEVATRDSGFTGTTITWGSNSGSQWATIIVELDASSSGATEVPLGLVTETDTAQSVAPRKTVALGQPSETDTAQSITPRKNVAVGLPVETNTAQPLTALKTVALGLSEETDTALSITPQFVVPLGLAEETDEALAITVRKTAVVGIAEETDTALSITVVQEGAEAGGGQLALKHLGS